MIKKLLIILVFIFNINSKVDLIIYSYNRPMQLYALLESIERYVVGIGKTFVIYRSANQEFENKYKEVQENFTWTEFVVHSHTEPYKYFKPITMECIFNKESNPYFLIAMDDNIVTDFVDLEDAITNMEKFRAFAFFLRLGTNINECFMTKTKTPVPCFKIFKGIFCWIFKNGSGDWAFPINHDMTIYRKKDMKESLEKLDFDGFHNWETRWCQMAADMNKHGLCYERSKIVNITANLVNPTDGNYEQFTSEWKRKMNDFSTENLLKKFNDGLKINIDDFYQINNKAPHIEYEYNFIKR